MREQQLKLNKDVKTARGEYLAEQMSNLKIGQEDLKEMKSLPYEVEERLIQVEGNFYKWDPILYQNILIK